MSELRRSSGADLPDPGTSRSTSRTIRSWCLYLATTIGLVCAIATWGLVGVVISVVVVAMATAVVASSMWGGDGRVAVARVVRVTLGAGLMTPAAVGLIAVAKVAGVLVVVILALTTPALTSLVQARRKAKGDRPVVRPEPTTPRDSVTPLADGPAAITPAPELSSLGDEALCLAWRRSFRLLETAPTAAERLSVVEKRQQYLDELHRRSPEGLAAWLASGARASGNPLPYVDDARRRAS
ncbi:hypothetical protein E0H73_13030 [Kribbella pittospori]|uniref:Uncharacterized protein n=1 Tax=Kribbella pittospori TaxID=722689 RepID=A0A4R0L3W7_9ACTN|nr:hypothetical protein [Kribbella pittospori]TCC63365.1 hypothetical protein E0H73_13030 [Kribbella pittospori]